ncbi:MAG: hypothetical protein JNL58_08145 [Planctomyces sp.]|nr:hypothetical protein [Planctomyces sp.]
MAATPFRLAVCTRQHPSTKTPQHGWRVIQQLADGNSRTVSPQYYGVDSKRVATAFLEGLLTGWFAMQRMATVTK